MTKCGKGLLPECEYYTSAGCVSPFNCPYKVEEISINSATSTLDTGIQKYFQGLVKVGIIPQEPVNYDAATLKMYIAHLEDENAELRAKLETAVELPCKLGDMVYKVYDKCDGSNCPYNGCFGQWRCLYKGKQRCEPFISTEQFCYGDIPFINKTVFTSKEAAEARLKEIKEEI